MKIWEIFLETPNDLGKPAPFVFNIDGQYMSIGALKRDYQLLGTFTLDSIEYYFWLINGKNSALVTTVSTEQDAPDAPSEIINDRYGNRRHLIITTLELTPTTLEIPNGLRAVTVSTNSRFRNLGFATMLYVVLARYGYKIISDFDQYTGGVELWKKLSNESTWRKYCVRIWDITEGDYVKDKNGNPIKYDGKNLAHDAIWNKVRSMSEKNTVLILSSN